MVTCHVAYRFTRPATEEILDIEIPYSKEEINEAKDTLLRKMKFLNCYVRPI